MNKRVVLGSLVTTLAGGVLAYAVVWELSIVNSVEVAGHRLVVRKATELSLPPVPGSREGFDCNSPLFWEGETLVSFTSHEHPFRGTGKDLEHLNQSPAAVNFVDDQEKAPGGRWIEAVYPSRNGRLYMWYHNEPKGIVPHRVELTAPRIGQMYSDDSGRHWHDQGFILEADRSTFNVETNNRYFVGGFGDFSVVPDQQGEYLYFAVSSYHRDPARQGIALARMAISDLDYPVGQVKQWDGRDWTSPGLGGETVPFLPAEVDWHRRNAQVYWGPSVHFNTKINAYVMLMNKAADSGWRQAGVYVSINPRIDDPKGWSAPVKLLDTNDWYPQIVGTDPKAKGTDRSAGHRARLFLKGKSSWEIAFD